MQELTRYKLQIEYTTEDRADLIEVSKQILAVKSSKGLEIKIIQDKF